MSRLIAMLALGVCGGAALMTSANHALGSSAIGCARQTHIVMSSTPRAASAAADANAAMVVVGRRNALFTAGAALLAGLSSAEVAHASGGATAGKYTTIPIAKRRYFGRVKQGVYEFNNMEAVLTSGDVRSEGISNFFAQTIKTQSKRQKTNCRGGGDACVVKEEFSSRWEDMQLAMFLLGNAFRLDSGKPPEKVRQVKEAKVFFAEMEQLRKASQAGNRDAATMHYVAARDALNIFLNDVELPPTDDPVYFDAADETVPSLCQGSFCI
uniref:Uncharacterized protein n=1 Tax=Chrysotila carterae TaxID=13221 RepID=A0A7S4ETH5_CHRCT|mmetsp:Transcript_58753/g.127623  ORF Transcript_58753/g.127623 Transcript_58753/m.127623 type:complete len:269 (-) Transcript_58753:506-1312(-)